MKLTRKKTLEALRGPHPEDTFAPNTVSTELKVVSYEVLEELTMDEEWIEFGNFLFTSNPNATEGNLVKAKVVFKNGHETVDYFKLVKNYKQNHHFTKGVFLAYGLESFVNPTLYDNSNIKFPFGKIQSGQFI